MQEYDTAYLRYILDAISRIEQYTQEIDYDAFLENTLVQDGVLRQIEIIGEATKRLSPGIRDKYSHILWKDITGMKGKLIHDYFGVDIDAVWDTVEKDIPILKQEIRDILKEEQ